MTHAGNIESNRTQSIKLHYYLNDNSHSMNAFIHNAMEKEFLEFLKEVAKILQIDIEIEVEAREEGGLIDFIIVGIKNEKVQEVLAQILVTVITSLVIDYFTGGREKRRGIQLDNELKKLAIEEKKIELEAKMLQLQNLQDNMEKAKESKELKKRSSNFYKKAVCDKIDKIGYTIGEDSEEIVVSRDEFEDFIHHETEGTESIDNANIEIISPVLKRDKYNWKGIYRDEAISFKMEDKEFKEQVINQEHQFSNGTVIICQLEIHRIYDEEGEEIKVSYSVTSVNSIEHNGNTASIARTKKNIKKDSLRQVSLFDTNEEE